MSSKRWSAMPLLVARMERSGLKRARRGGDGAVVQQPSLGLRGVPPQSASCDMPNESLTSLAESMECRDRLRPALVDGRAFAKHAPSCFAPGPMPFSRPLQSLCRCDLVHVASRVGCGATRRTSDFLRPFI